MNYPPGTVAGVFRRRYKRFFADLELPTGEVITAHCVNSGSMRGLLLEGAPALVSPAANPARKLKYTWEAVRVGPAWVGINTIRANALVAEAVAARAVPELAGYAQVRREVRATGDSRFDFALERPGEPTCYVEVKSVTLAEGPVALFPDAVTARGTKHLRGLATLAAGGHRAVLLYVVQRADCTEVRPADMIDPAYGRALREALAQGVEVLAYDVRVTPEGLHWHIGLPVRI